MQSPSRSHTDTTSTTDGGTPTGGDADVEIDPERDLPARHRRVLETFGRLDDAGKSWAKSAEVARRLPDASARQVGGALRTLRERDLVEKWNPNASSATWGLTDAGEAIAAEISEGEGDGGGD